MKTTKTKHFWNQNEIKNKKYNNGKQIELGQMIKLKTNGKIWERIQKESKNIGKTATDTHVWIFRFFRCSTPIPDCLSFDFSFILFFRFSNCDSQFQFSDVWYIQNSCFNSSFVDLSIFVFRRFPISGFRFTSVSSICLFSFSEIWFPISGVRFTSVWHFHKACFILCLLDFPISHL